MFPAVPLLSPSLVSARHHVVTLSLPRLSRGNHIIVMAVRLFPIPLDRVISAATIGMCAFFTPSMPVFLIFVLLLISGFFRWLQFTASRP